MVVGGESGGFRMAIRWWSGRSRWFLSTVSVRVADCNCPQNETVYRRRWTVCRSEE